MSQPSDSNKNHNGGGGIRRGWRSRSSSRARKSKIHNNNNHNNAADDDDELSTAAHLDYAAMTRNNTTTTTMGAPGGAAIRIHSSTMTAGTDAQNAATTTTNSSIGGDSYTYAPPTPRSSKGLTGNISSLFRRASGRSLSQDGQDIGSIGAVPTNASSTANSSVMVHHHNHNGGGDDDGISAPTSPHRTSLPNSPRFMSSLRNSRRSETAAAASAATNNAATANNPTTLQVPNQDGQHKHRLFYSNADDDDSQDSFETRTRSGLSSSHDNAASSSRIVAATAGAGGINNKNVAKHSYGRYQFAVSSSSVETSAFPSGSDAADTTGYETSTHGGHLTSYTTAEDTTEASSTYHTRGKYNDEDGTYCSTVDNKSNQTTTILRYRGFSTSIQSLFLDEALVCASMGCFGLILSNRTEYLLQLRNDRRGVQWGPSSSSSSRRTLPSRIVAYALLLTLLLIGITFVIWGFGSDNAVANTWYSGGSSNSNNKNGSGNNQNAGDDGVVADDQITYDDQQQQQQYQNDDGQQQNNDDAVAANNNDDAAAAANDDGNANNNNNDDYGQNNNYYYNNNYQQQQVNDDAAANDDYDNDEGGNGDDYYNYNENNGGRQLDTTIGKIQSDELQAAHPFHGIFKIRDMKEGLWEPAFDFLSDEWYRPYEQKQEPQQHHHHRTRLLEEYNNYGYDTDSEEYTTSTHHRDLAADLRVSFIIAFLIVLGVLGRRRRMRTRYYLVRARAQEDHLFYASSGTGIKRVGFQDSREDQYEGACSHTLCGFYPVDPPRDGDEIDDEVQVGDDGVRQRRKKARHADCVSRGFNCLMGLCCGLMCRCWFQCLSICALAQEAREIRLLVPTRFQRVDYITHQPFHEYQKNVNDLRKGWLGKSRKKTGIMPHFNALSRLSRYILMLSLFVLLVIVSTLLFNPRASFSWPDVVILLATFLQSFLVIWVVHWIFHKSDLSLDAVIKMFAAGFVIAVPAAFFFEGLLVNLTLTMAYIFYGIAERISGDAFINWVIKNYRIMWILGEIFNAYVVAAVTEELSKYYTFRCVEHPDLLFLTGLVSETQDERALEGGLVKYPFSSHQVQQTNARNPYDDEASQYSRGSHRSKTSKSATLDSNLDDDDFFEDEPDVRTYRQKAAAVTTGMISVAVGLACAENFLYVFLLGGTSGGSSESSGSYLEEWIVLLFRSIFPVHALAAAMQSVNMIRKFVETDQVNGHRIGVGRIILPAVIMHGSFDAILLGINVFIESSWDDYLEKNGGGVDPENPPYNPLLVNGVAWFSIILVMLLGLLWYYRENRSQRLRLILLDEQEKARESGSHTYTSPGPHSSEMDLVL